MTPKHSGVRKDHHDPGTVSVAVTSPSFSKNEILRGEILAIFPRTRFNDGGHRFKGEELARYVGESDGLIVGLEPVDAHLLSRCPDLRFVAKYGVGLDNVDLAACEARGVKVGWTGGVNRLSVAELTLTFMLGLCRNVFPSSYKLKAQTWIKSGGWELSRKTVGIIGVGHVGKEVVRVLAPFHCRILVNDIIDQQEYYDAQGLSPVSKEELFAQSDVVTIHTPLTDETHHLVNRATLSLMKCTAFLINTARGAIVNQPDLRWALENGIIAGTALDVFEEEPPSDAAFLALPNLVVTPHIGGGSQEAVLAMGRSAIGHIKDFFRSH